MMIYNGGASTMRPAAGATRSPRICETNASIDQAEESCSEAITDDCYEQEFDGSTQELKLVIQGSTPDCTKEGGEESLSTKTDSQNSSETSTIAGNSNSTSSSTSSSTSGSSSSSEAADAVTNGGNKTTTDYAGPFFGDAQAQKDEKMQRGAGTDSVMSGEARKGRGGVDAKCAKNLVDHTSPSAADIPTPRWMMTKLNGDGPCGLPLLRACSVRTSGEAEALAYLWEKKTDEEIVSEVEGILGDFDILRKECDEIFAACVTNKDKTSTIPIENLYHVTQRLIDSLGCRNEAVLERIALVFEAVARGSEDDIAIVQFRGYVACVLTQILNELMSRTSSSRGLELGTRDKIEENPATPHMQHEAKSEKCTDNPTDVHRPVAGGDTEGDPFSEKNKEASLLDTLRGVFENMADTISGLTA